MNRDAGPMKFSPFSMQAPAPGPTLQGMPVAPAGYRSPQPNFNLPRMAMSPQLQAAMASRAPIRSPTGAMAQGMPAVAGANPLPGGAGAPTMPGAGAQPPVGYGRPPTTMNPQYQQALVSALRTNGQ